LESPSRDEHFAEFAYLHVVGFEIQMDDPLGMGEGHGVADFEEYFEQAPQGELPQVFLVALMKMVEDAREVDAAEQLHGEEGLARKAGSGFVDRDDVRMLQARGQESLLEKGLGSRPLRIVHDGHGDVATYLYVVDAKDGLHAAFAYDALHLVFGGRRRYPFRVVHGGELLSSFRRRRGGGLHLAEAEKTAHALLDQLPRPVGAHRPQSEIVGRNASQDGEKQTADQEGDEQIDAKSLQGVPGGLRQKGFETLLEKVEVQRRSQQKGADPALNRIYDKRSVGVVTTVPKAAKTLFPFSMKARGMATTSWPPIGMAKPTKRPMAKPRATLSGEPSWRTILHRASSRTSCANNRRTFGRTLLSAKNPRWLACQRGGSWGAAASPSFLIFRWTPLRRLSLSFSRSSLRRL
jgi:hypothetical protein